MCVWYTPGNNKGSLFWEIPSFRTDARQSTVHHIQIIYPLQSSTFEPFLCHPRCVAVTSRCNLYAFYVQLLYDYQLCHCQPFVKSLLFTLHPCLTSSFNKGGSSCVTLSARNMSTEKKMYKKGTVLGDQILAAPAQVEKCWHKPILAVTHM
jgi:hypothetical protein